MRMTLIGLVALLFLAACNGGVRDRTYAVRIGMSRAQVEAACGGPDALDFAAMLMYSDGQRSHFKDLSDLGRHWKELKPMADIWYYGLEELSFSENSVRPNPAGVFEGRASLAVRFGPDGRVEDAADWAGLSPVKMLVADRTLIQKHLDRAYRDLYK